MMGDKTAIEWTDATWNPILGCSKVSPGCDNCYAIAQSHRCHAMGLAAYDPPLTIRTDEGTDWTGEVRYLPERLDQPIRWKRPRRIFVNSMSDLFHPDVQVEQFFEILAVMVTQRRHTFQVLTKRPKRMAAAMDAASRGIARVELNSRCLQAGINVTRGGDGDHLGDHIWLGTSIESNRYAFRADHLRATPAAVRWISAEPLLGPLDRVDLDGIAWVVVGGESGPGARAMHPDWVRDLRDRCAAAGVAFLFKQWGNWAPGRGGMVRVGKKTAGRELDRRTWDEYPA